MTRISKELLFQFPSEQKIESHLKNLQEPKMKLSDDQIATIAAAFQNRCSNPTHIENKIKAIMMGDSEPLDKEETTELDKEKEKIEKLAKSLQECARKPFETQSPETQPLKRSFRCISLRDFFPPEDSI